MKALLIPALFSALGILAGAQLPQEPEQEPGGGPSLMELQMEMMRLAQPGPEHEELAKGVGAWESAVTMTTATAVRSTPSRSTTPIPSAS